MTPITGTYPTGAQIVCQHARRGTVITLCRDGSVWVARPSAPGTWYVVSDAPVSANPASLLDAAAKMAVWARG